MLCAFFSVQKKWIEANSNLKVLHLIGILASTVSVLSIISRKVRHAVGTSIYSVLIGARILLLRDNI